MSVENVDALGAVEDCIFKAPPESSEDSGRRFAGFADEEFAGQRHGGLDLDPHPHAVVETGREGKPLEGILHYNHRGLKSRSVSAVRWVMDVFLRGVLLHLVLRLP